MVVPLVRSIKTYEILSEIDVKTIEKILSLEKKFNDFIRYFSNWDWECLSSIGKISILWISSCSCPRNNNEFNSSTKSQKWNVVWIFKQSEKKVSDILLCFFRMITKQKIERSWKKTDCKKKVYQVYENVFLQSYQSISRYI